MTRLFPVNLIKGELNQNDLIYNGEFEIGKILINKEYPFALVKYLDDHFNEKNEFKCGSSIIKVKQPNWIKE